MDLFVVAACGLTFAAVVGPGMHAAPKGPSIALIAQEKAGRDDVERIRRAAGHGHGKVSAGQVSVSGSPAMHRPAPGLVY
jgi:hypothetical protein